MVKFAGFRFLVGQRYQVSGVSLEVQRFWVQGFKGSMILASTELVEAWLLVSD